MAWEFRGRVRGAGAVDGRLRRLARLGSPEVKVRALLAGGEVIATEAQALAPKRSGLMASRIQAFVPEGSAAGGSISSGDVRVVVAPVGDDVFYWIFDEFGTATQPANPFLRTALDNHGQAAFQAIGGVYAAEVRKVGA